MNNDEIFLFATQVCFIVEQRIFNDPYKTVVRI